MRLLHYLEIRNFKRFGDTQRIELDHPAVLIGPNNCGKTTAIQALALWSQAVRAWQEKKGQAPPKERTSTSLNRLSIVSVPVQRTRYFWHNAAVRTGNHDIRFQIKVGVLHDNRVEPVAMTFRNQGDDLVYCTPDTDTLARPEVIATAAALKVELLYPMSGLETEEPVLQRGRIDVLLGQGQTAQVLRNLCLLVWQEDRQHWARITDWMRRLFYIELGEPAQTARGGIDLLYRQEAVKEPLDIALAGRGLQQMLLVFAYLYSHPGSVLLIDEPDAHLEILRQRQVYVLLRELASENASQVILGSRSFGPFEGFVKVYSGCETTPSSSVWYLIIDDDELWESCGLMSESAKRGGEPREGVRGRGRKRRGDWRTKHLRACLLCGRVWRPGRRRTCPVCHVDRSICLTCDQVAVEDRARRCATDEALRRLVKACAGDWERARRALDAAGGDVPRALARAERAGSAKRVSGRGGRRCSGE